MSELRQLDKLIQEIKLFIRYAVPEDEMKAACLLVDRYRNDRRVVNMLREYYVALPNAKEEMVTRVSYIMQQQGVFLFVLTTTSSAHLYAVSVDAVVWLGEYPGELEAEALTFLGFADQEEFSKICTPIRDLEDHTGSVGGNGGECPVCGVFEGECHLLGCAVEVCPWCKGQLNRCNCRFEQLAVDAVNDDEHLERFIELLTAKGRIPFQRLQAPYYPGTSDGLDRDEKEN